MKLIYIDNDDYFNYYYNFNNFNNNNNKISINNTVLCYYNIINNNNFNNDEQPDNLFFPLNYFHSKPNRSRLRSNCVQFVIIELFLIQSVLNPVH